MLRSQAEKLNSTGLALLDKAESVAKASDVRSYTELGMKCLEESRDILEGLKRNSILIFIECCSHLFLETPGRYGAYLDFCARNGLDILSEEDFKSLMAEFF